MVRMSGSGPQRRDAAALILCFKVSIPFGLARLRSPYATSTWLVLEAGSATAPVLPIRRLLMRAAAPMRYFKVLTPLGLAKSPGAAALRFVLDARFAAAPAVQIS